MKFSSDHNLLLDIKKDAENFRYVREYADER